MQVAFGLHAAPRGVVAAAAAKPAREKALSGKKSGSRRTHGGPEYEFEGSDACAVEYLVRQGVRPAARAAQRLLDAQQWVAAQPSAAPREDGDAAAPRAPRGGGGGAPTVRFAQARDAVKLLLEAGVSKKLLPRTLERFPGVLALHTAELDARLDALDALGLETPATLGRAIEKAPTLLALPVEACAAAGAALTALGVPDVGALLGAAPEMLCEPPAALAARAEALGALTGLQPPALGALAARHPPLLARPLGKETLADRAAFWTALGVDAGALAAATPAALTAAVATALRPKVVFADVEMGLSAPQAVARCAALFGTVNLERTVRPRWAYLRGVLGVASDAAIAALPDWAQGDAEAFVAAAAVLASGAPAEQLSADAFRAHGAALAGADAPEAAAESDDA
jgi:hypothetical protein